MHCLLVGVDPLNIFQEAPAEVEIGPFVVCTVVCSDCSERDCGRAVQKRQFTKPCSDSFRLKCDSATERKAS